jgi:hypothetical protein
MNSLASEEEETEGGLIVPSHSIRREQETWTKEDVKKLDKIISLFEKRGMKMVAVCETCQKPVRLMEREDGRWVLRCRHKDRVLKRDV